VLGDLVFSAAAVYTGALLRIGSKEFYQPIALQQVLLFLGSTVCISYALGLYNIEKNTVKKELFLRILTGAFCSFFTIVFIDYLLHTTIFHRGLIFVSLLLFGILQYLWHIGFISIAQRVIVLGAGALARRIGDLILTTNQQYVLHGYVNLTGESVQVPEEAIIQNVRGLVATMREGKATKLVVSISERRGFFPVEEVMNCKFSGIEVVDALSFYEEITGKLLVENITPSWFIFSKGFRMTVVMKLYKRTIDFVFSMIGLLLTLPFLPFVALLIKLDSRGPVFFSQVRVGEMDRPFVIHKLRTMRQNAELGKGEVWAEKNDPRITRLGWFLRKTRIDELPQLINVLKGEMSFIGPRPERPNFVAQLKAVVPYYSQRHFVKPGITGWAQIRYSYGASVEDALEKLRYDLYYIKNISITLENIIIFDTIRVMLFGRGAR